MNIYLLVEGEKTELQVYPKWISYMIPELVRVHSFSSVTDSSYYLFSGQGIPSIYNHAVNAIKDINSINKYNYLIIALDAEELTVEYRKSKVYEHLEKANIALNKNCKLEIIVHNRCMETWFLGNPKVYKRNPQGKTFRQNTAHYNVEINDPELMEKLPEFSRTAHFHESYLREMLKEHDIRYRKSRPKEVTEKYYFEELVKRVQNFPDHLKSLSSFINLFNRINAEIR